MNTKSLRKGVLFAAGLLAISASPMLAATAAIPQDAGQTQAAPADQSKPMRPDLNLTDDQKAQMKKIHEGAKSQIAAVNSDTTLSADQKQAKIQAIHRDMHKQTEALLKTLMVYTGKFTIDGDKFTTKVDISWSELFTGTDQVRFFTLERDKLTIRTAEQASAVYPGKQVVGTLAWERER